MTDPSLVSLFARPLNLLRVPYMVTGGVASVVYGEPRFTRDIDMVIDLRPGDASRFASAWSDADFYLPPVEVIREESEREEHGHFNIIHHQTTMRADIYLTGNDVLNAWALEHRVIRRIDEDDVSIAPIEAVMLSKLRYYRMGRSDRHLRDIHQMLRISGDLLDRATLGRELARLGLESEWQQAQDYSEPGMLPP